MSEPVSLEELRDWMDKCNPWAPVGPEHPFFVNFYDFEHQGQRISLRGEGDGAGPGLEQVANAIALAKDESCSLFSGFSGTGKSSELLGFKRSLERSGYLVLIADAQAYLNLKRPLTITELLIVVAAAFGDVAAKRLAEDSSESPSDGLGVPRYLTRFVAFLQQDVDLGSVKLPTGLADLQVGISTNQPFWIQVRDHLAASVGRLQRDAHDYVQEVMRALRRVYPELNGVVFVLDSLEKIRGAKPEEFDAVIDSVIDVFDKQASLVRFPCHIVYTIPPYVRQLSLGTYYDHVTEILPSIRVHERGTTEPYAPGVEALCELVRRRIPTARVFGPDEALLRRLVHYSGGHVRLLLTFVRDVLLRVARLGVPVELSTIDRVLQRHREDTEPSLWGERLPLLRDIIARGELSGMERAQLPVLAGLLDEYTVLCYRNGSGWYDVHPLVRDKVLQLIARQAEADQA